MKRLFQRVVYKLVTPPEIYVKSSYAQAGEDAVVSFLFNDKKIPSPSYLDLGTNSPDYLNNTFLFYQNGSSGVCVEADPSLFVSIRNTRPRDKVLNIGVAVGTEQGEADFYIFDHSPLNTFDKAEAEMREASGAHKIARVQKVKLQNINSIIAENFSRCPDFLSIDIEGLDLDVLQSLDVARFPVPVVCAETCNYSETHIRPKNQAIIDLMKSKGYFIYADTYINTIFVRSDWFYA